MAAGGLSLIVDHAAPPHFESLRLDAGRWAQARVETVEREMVGPNGEVGTMVDNLMVLRRAG
ncbi:MAG: hypothetical protein ACXVYI_12895 [Mycobacterium sp.]